MNDRPDPTQIGTHDVLIGDRSLFTRPGFSARAELASTMRPASGA